MDYVASSTANRRPDSNNSRCSGFLGMLDRLASPRYGLRILVEPALDSLQHMLVLPYHPSLLSTGLDRLRSRN
jgi:hypothetical protein